MGKSTAILYFSDALEVEASIISVNDIKDTLGDQATIVALTKDNWISKIDALLPDTLCFLATHGELGEDGTLQAYLELKGIPHTQSSATTSGILANKHLAKLIYLALGIPTPPWAFAGNTYGNGTVKHPLKKTKFGGSKQGIKTATQIENDTDNIYEEIIPGEFEVIVSVVRNKDEHIDLPAIVRKRSMTNWGELQKADMHIVPEEVRRQCQKYAQKLSETLDCYGVTKTDFVIDSNGRIWALETDAIPGLSRTGGAGEAAANANLTYEKLLSMIKGTIWKPTN